MKKIVTLAALFVITAVFFLACDNPVGLGEKLDLEGPRVTIISPEPRAIGEDFLLKGKVTDKSPIDRIKITAVLGSEDTFQKQWRYTRSTGKWEVSEDSGETWNPLTGGEWKGSENVANWVVPIEMTLNGSNTVIPEGEYMFSVQAWDSGDWSDDNSLKTHVLIFDKDPPKVTVFAPPLYRLTDSAFAPLLTETEWQKPELLGKFLTQEFQLQWQIKDNNAVKSIELRFYKEDEIIDNDVETPLPENYLYRYATNLLPSDFNGSIWVPDLMKPPGTYDGQHLTGGELLGGEIKASLDNKTVIKVVALCYDAAGHTNTLVQEKVLGHFIFWPQARAPWITYTDGMGTPKAYEGKNEDQYKELAEAGVTAKMFYPGRSVKSNSFQAQGVSKVEFQLYDYAAGVIPNYTTLTPLSLAYMELDEELDKTTHQLDAAKTTMTILNPKRKSGDFSTIFPWDFMPTKKSANYIVRARAFDFNGNAGEYYDAVFRVQDISFPDFPTSPQPAAGEPLFKFIGRPEGKNKAEGGYYDLPSATVTANSIRISGVVADMTNITSVYMVWINPESKGFAGMSQLSYYRDLNYAGWLQAIAAFKNTPSTGADSATAYIEESSLDPDHPNKVWRLRTSPLGENSETGRMEWRYDQEINLTRFNIGAPGNQPLKSQVFLLRAEGADEKKATIITYAPQGDEKFPEIKITNVTISGRTEPLKPNNNAVIAQFTPNQTITVNGTWVEDSTEFLPIETYFTPNFGVTVSGQTASVVLDPPSGVVAPPTPGDAAGGTWSATLGPISSTLAASLRDTLVVNVEGKDIGGNISEAGASWLIESDHLQLMRISSENTDKTYKSGDTIDIFLEFNKAVQISNYSTNNPPRLVLNLGNTVYATYVNSNSQSTRHHFTYTVANGHNTTKLDVTGLNNASGIAWNGNNYPFAWHRGSGAEREDIRVTTEPSHTGQILNGYRVRRLPTSTSGGNDATYSLGGGKNIAIDTAAPTVSSITASQAKDYRADDVITITVNFSEPVEFTSAPRLQLRDSNQTTTTLLTDTSVSGNTTSSLTFTYTVKDGDTTNGRAVRITGHTGTITDLAGNNLATTAISGNNGATLTGRYIDALKPTAPTVRILSANNVNNVLSNTVGGTAREGISGPNTTAQVALGTVYNAVYLAGDPNPILYLAIQGSTTSAGGTSTGAHKLARLEYSIKGDTGESTSWVRLVKTDNSLNIDNTPIALKQAGPYTLVARQIDRAGNESASTQPITFNWDPGSLVTRISSSEANGTYTHNQGRNSIPITVYFRKPLYVTAASITLNALRGSGNGTAITVSATPQNNVSSLTFTYTVEDGDRMPSGTNVWLNVDSMSITATDAADSATRVAVGSYCTVPAAGNNLRLNENKQIRVETGALTNTAAPTFIADNAGGTGYNDPASANFHGIRSDDGSYWTTLQIPFNHNINKGSGNITIQQVAANYRLPAVLTETQYSRFKSVANFDKYYTKGTNGYIDGQGSDTSAKYVLNYSIVPSSTLTGDAATFATDFRTAEWISLSVNSAAVTIDGQTLKVRLSGSNAPQVPGATYAVAVPAGFVTDNLGGSNTAIASEVVLRGVARPFVRIKRTQDTIATATAANNTPRLTATQPFEAKVRMDSRTPGSSIVYNRTQGTYVATDRNWSTANGPNTNNTTNSLPSRPGSATGTSYTNGNEITIGNTNYGGYQWWVRAQASATVDGTSYTSTEAEEVAYRTAITYRLQGRGTSTGGNAGGDYREISAGNGESVLADGDQIWIRGGDAIGSSSIPGFPFTWEDDWSALANKRAGIRLMTKVNVTTQTGGTNANRLNNSQWQFLTWDMNATAYVDFIRGRDLAEGTYTESSVQQAWQYGPRRWAYQRSGWTSFKLKYPINPGEHRWLDTGEDWSAKYAMNFSDTFSVRSNLTVNHTSPNQQ